MSVHRFRELWNSHQSIPAAPSIGSAGAFFACPYPVAFGMAPIWQAQVEYLYRLAFEQAKAQVGRNRPDRWPAFSVN